MWQTLDDIPPGSLFETEDGIRAVKSEYHYDNHNPQPLCILLTSGEFAHFPDKERTRVRVVDQAAALRAAERAGMERAAALCDADATNWVGNGALGRAYAREAKDLASIIRSAAATPAPAGDD